MIHILVLLFGLLVSPAFAQNTTCANKPASDNSNACANTRYVTSAFTAAYPLMWLKSIQGTGGNATATTFSAANQALWLVGNYTGSGTGPFAEISATDTANSGGSNFPNTALRIDHNINSGAGAGNRNTLLPVLTKNAAIAGSDGTKKFYTPFFSQMYAYAGDGGSPGTPMGSYYGMSSILQLLSGATYVSSAAGGEIDVSVATGASVDLKVGLLLASVNDDAVKGTSYDGFLSFGADSTTTAKWTYGITFGWPKGPWAFDTSSTLIGSVASTTPRVANWFIDGTNITYTSGFAKFPGGQIGPTGAMTVASLDSTAGITATTGTFSSTISGTAISGTTGTFSSTVSGVAGTFSGTVTGANLTTAGNATALHYYSTVSVPTTSSCGTSPAVDAGSSSHAGKITFGSATTTCTLTFASAFANNAFCTVTPGAQPAASANIPYISAQSKTAFTIAGGTASAVYYYTCGGN